MRMLKKSLSFVMAFFLLLSIINAVQVPVLGMERSRGKNITNILNGLKPIDAINRFKALDTNLRFVIGDIDKNIPTVVGGAKLSAVLSGSTTTDKAYSFLSANKDLFNITNPNQELILNRSFDIPTGGQVMRFKQTYNGLPVVNGEVIVQLDKDGQAQAAGGLFLSQVTALPAGTPSAAITKAQALEKAKASVNLQSLVIPPILKPTRILPGQLNLNKFPDSSAEPASGSVENASAHDPQLMYMVSSGKPLLVYSTEIDATNQMDPAYWQVYVDANTGEIVDRINIRMDGWDNVGMGNTLMGEANVKFPVWFGWNPGTNVLWDRSNWYSGGPIVYTTNANSTNGSTDAYVTATNGHFTSAQAAAVSAHYYAGLTVDYFSQFLGLKQPWPDDSKIKVVVNYGNAYNNAFYTNGKITLGTGNNTNWSNFAKSLDVVAHEITHGVTSKLSGLQYYGQSGALNESYSDVFGTVVEYFGQHNMWDWKMGEDCYTPSKAGDALRYMDNPTLGGQPKHISSYVNTTSDNGGVHTNSGIPNYVFYRAVALSGGENYIQPMAEIWFRTLDYYVTPTTQFNTWAAWLRFTAATMYPSLYSAVDQALKEAGL